MTGSSISTSPQFNFAAWDIDFDPETTILTTNHHFTDVKKLALSPEKQALWAGFGQLKG
jgi:hypothetical protein